MDFSGANLTQVNLNDANLSEANLCGVNLNEADLLRANLVNANLNNTSLMGVDLLGTDLRGAILAGADFKHNRLPKFGESYFRAANMGGTVFGNSDLSEAVGLESAFHFSPSYISTDVFTLSKGNIPKPFLRGCGLSDWEIEQVKLYNPDLTNEDITQIQYKIYELRATQTVQISPLFISYSHADGNFVGKVGDSLSEKGIRYWRDIHDMKSGRIETQIDRAIRHNPTVLLVLSEKSIQSDWVEHEVRTARELEKELGRDTLCPVSLDDSWKSSPWPKRVMEQVMEYNILDFSEWEDDSKFEDMFRRLIDGLELFYKG